MILSKPSWANLTGEPRLTARLDELARRLDSWEAAQYNSWSFAADSRGAELEARQAAIEARMEQFAAKICDLPEVFFHEAELERLAARVGYLESDNGELTRRLNQALDLAQALAGAAGFMPWDGTPEGWPAWLEHVTGRRPQE